LEITAIDASYTCPFCNAPNSSLWILTHHLRSNHQATARNKKAVVATSLSLQLSSYGLKFDPRFNLLICVSKCEGIAARDIQNHVRRCNAHANTDALNALLDGKPFADVNQLLPLEIDTPIPGITVSDGLRCNICGLAISSPSSAPKKRLNEHYKNHHPHHVDSAVEDKGTRCFYQTWFGGDGSYRNNHEPSAFQWRNVITKSKTVAPEPPSSHSVQLEQFDQLFSPLPVQSDASTIIDRRELGAVVNRLHLAPFASIEKMRAHVALSHAHQQTALDGINVFQLCRNWIRLVGKTADTLPDTVLCWLMTTK
jgi:hypothetical protein